MLLYFVILTKWVKFYENTWKIFIKIYVGNICNGWIFKI